MRSLIDILVTYGTLCTGLVGILNICNDFAADVKFSSIMIIVIILTFFLSHYVL